MPYFIYVLRSEKNNKLYVGSTAKDPRERLLEHNNRQNKWTSVNGPFKLIYYEKLSCVTCVRIRERFLKSGVGKEFLKLLVTIK